MATSATAKLVSAAADLLASSAASRRRPLTCGASTRIAPQPPDLIRWVRGEGGFVHPKLKLSHHPSLGLSVVADANIPNGSELIALPDHLPLRLRWSHDAADPNDRPDSLLHQLVHQVPEELWAMRLGLKLLQERAMVSSYWWPYIGNLPEAFTVPIFFSGEEIKSLHYAPLVQQVNKRCRFLIDFEKEVNLRVKDVVSAKHPFCGQEVRAASLGWATSAVSSRAFRLHGSRNTNEAHANIPMLLPLIDMCNHSFHPNAHIVQEQDSTKGSMLVQVIAATQIEQGAPVTLNYGCLSNDLFLLDYGFVVPSNPFDHVELKYDGVLLEAASMAAGISSSFSKPAAWQFEILSQMNLHGDGAISKVNLGGKELVDSRLLAELRVLLASDNKVIENHNLDDLKALSSEAPLGVPTEMDVLRTLIALCAICLQQFPTKIMEDENLLQGDISTGMRLAILFRMHKKSMIIDTMKELSKRVRVLGMERPTVQS